MSDAVPADAVLAAQGVSKSFGPVPVLFIVLRRKRAKGVLAPVREVAPQAFVSMESVGPAIGGMIFGF